MEEREHILTLGFATVHVRMTRIGNDRLITVEGGTKPHIGCVVMAVPRPSLTGAGTVSCTSSVLNVTGHKDEYLCRALAEKAAVRYSCTAVCCGGVHLDHITEDQIRQLTQAVEQIEL